MFLGLVHVLLSTGRTRLITARRCVQLFRIQAIEDGPDGPEFLPDPPRPARHPTAEEEEDITAAGGEGDDDAPPARGEGSQEPVGPGKQSAPAGGARGWAGPGRLLAVSRMILLMCP